MSNQYVKSLSLVFILFLAKHSFAQKMIALDAGQMFSTFRFKDDIGSKEKGFSNMLSGCYGISYHQDSVFMKGLFMRAGLGMRKGGASMILDVMDYTWSLQYIVANAGMGYMYTLKRVSPYAYLSPYFGYLLKGKQMMGEYPIDLVASKDIKTTDFGACFSPGVKITLSDYLSVFTEARYVLGLQNIEATAGQTLYNRGFSVNLGAAFSISKYKAEDNQKVLDKF